MVSFSMYRGISSAGVVIYFIFLFEYAFDPGWWLEDSRVKVEGLVSPRVSKGDPVLDCIWLVSCRRLPFFL